MPVRRTRDLEVHVAEMILVTEDVRQDDRSLAVRDEAHRDTRNRCLQRHTSIEQREGRATDRSHRRRTVRLEGLGHHADRVREVVVVRQHGRNRSLGQRAMPHLTPSRTAERPRLAHREGREVVVEHEVLLPASTHAVDRLLVEATTERRRHDGLGLAAGEERNAVGPGVRTNLTGDLPDLVAASAVDALACGHHAFAHQLTTEIVKDILHVALQRLQTVRACFEVGQASSSSTFSLRYSSQISSRISFSTDLTASARAFFSLIWKASARRSPAIVSMRYSSR